MKAVLRLHPKLLLSDVVTHVRDACAQTSCRALSDGRHDLMPSAGQGWRT